MKIRRQLPASGFTLIEVVVSLGVFAFAMVVIVGALVTAGGYAGNDAKRALAVELLHTCFRDYDLQPAGSGRTPTLGLAPLVWDAKPVKVRLWFDGDGTVVSSERDAFYVADLTATPDPAGQLGHLHGRMLWPARSAAKRREGEVELFTSLKLP